MTSEDRDLPRGLPEGDSDPNSVYIAVGKAIHSWEGLEQALAYLYLKMNGLADTPSNLAAFGSRNRRFSERIAAVDSAGWAYFIKEPDQHREGEFKNLVDTAMNLAIERHRIAHGHMSVTAELCIPPGVGAMSITAPAEYRWGAPFYSTGGLRTDPFGKGSTAINAITQDFMDLHNRVHLFTESL